MNIEKYHYTECGLDNIYIEVWVQEEADGEKTITVPRIIQLHQHIAKGVIEKKSKLNRKEVRFLRVELRLTQGELAERLGVTEKTVMQWEDGEKAITAAADKKLRIAVFAMLVEADSPAIKSPSKITLEIVENTWCRRQQAA